MLRTGVATLVLIAALSLSGADKRGTSYRTASLTGCLDEQPGPKYVLRGFKQVKQIAELEPDGFPPEAFAKYLRKRVQVRGRLSSGNEPEVMKVKTIKPLTGACEH